MASKKPSLPAPPKVCKHLNGSGYEEYIRLIRTRALGGVSPDLRARAVRQLFPYKNLPRLEREPRKKDLHLIFIEIQGKAGAHTLIPKDGNRYHKERKWTKVEKRRLDEFLLGWARWEVDYVNGFVRSVHCEGTIKNADSICDACISVSQDESLKRAVRKVRRTIIVCK